MAGSTECHGKRIAVVVAGAVTGETGGAERFYLGLQRALADQGCAVDLINVPTDEATFEHILANYERCRSLDLSSYDLVISTKAPTYVVQHPNHVVYLVHTVRVFYDMFDQAFPAPNDELFRQRQQIHDLDNQALRAAKARFAIGYEVAARMRRWNAVDAQVLHPPLGMNRFRRGRTGDYFFLPGRLHPWKRVDLAIRAVKASRLPLRLLIAGTGEVEAGLRRLAGSDPRIEFVGRVTDDQLIDHYADCLAALFLPVREDYGYVTLEAFASAKPVITCPDSGEPLQFVAHGRTGWVCEPDAESLRSAMEHALSHPAEAERLGASGHSATRSITWPAVAEKLLAAGFAPQSTTVPTPPGTNRRIQVAVLDMQPIDPPVGGGRLRLLGLYHALGKDFETRYVGSYDWPGEPLRRKQLTPTLEELVVPLSDDHHAAARRLSEAAGGKTVIDIAFARLGHLSADYLRAAREAVDWADVVVFSHPWVYPLVAERVRLSQLVVYDSQNVEGFLRAQLLETGNDVDRELLRGVLAAEYHLGLRAELVLACSEEDRERFARLYEWPEERMRIVPNGVMARQVVPASDEQRADCRRRLGIEQGARVAIFLGSAYGPNVEAARFIVDALAPASPELTYAIVGGVGDQLRGLLARNVKVTGFVDEAARTCWLHAADMAVNPMFAGSGTNIKMFDFMAAGLPVVTTPTGARGIAGEGACGLRVVDGNAGAFVTALRGLAADEAVRLSLGRQARAAVEERFAWESISPRLGELVRRAFLVHQATPKTRRRIALLSTWNVRCGIAEHASYLASALQDAGCDVTALGNESPEAARVSPIAEMLVPCVRVWVWDNVHWSASRVDLEKLGRALQRCRPDLLLIQHHTGFLGNADYAAILRSAEAMGVPVLVEAHNARELAHAGLEQWPGGDKVRLWVHDEDECGPLCDRTTITVSVQPLPVRMPAPQPPHLNPAAPDAGPVLAGFGFLRRYKGVKTAIAIVAALKTRYPGIRYVGLHASYHEGESAGFLQECLEEARRLGVSASIQIDPRFLPIDEVIARLSEADAILLPYEPSVEGSSAAANVGIAAGRPLLTSDSLIFRPLKELVTVIDSLEPAVWADAVTRLLDDPERMREHEARLRRWAERHSYAMAAAGVLELVDALNGVVQELADIPTPDQDQAAAPRAAEAAPEPAGEEYRPAPIAETIDFEQRVQIVYESILRPGMIAVDVGAHAGRHAFEMVRLVSPSGHVYMFEPLPPMIGELQRKRDESPHLKMLTSLYPYALSATSGAMEFCVASRMLGYSGLRERCYDADTEVERIQVEVRRLDEVLPSLRRLDYLKIDTEGGEWDVMRGAADLIERFRPVITFEFGEASYAAYGVNPLDVYSFLCARGYVVVDIRGRVLEAPEFARSSVRQELWDYAALPPDHLGLAGRLRALT